MIIIPLYVQVMGAPVAGQTNEFDELKQQLDVVDADIGLLTSGLTRHKVSNVFPVNVT